MSGRLRWGRKGAKHLYELALFILRTRSSSSSVPFELAQNILHKLKYSKNKGNVKRKDISKKYRKK